MESIVQNSLNESSYEQILGERNKFDICKHRGRKDDVKLLQSVNKVKQKYNSLHQACRLADISWAKFHRHTYIKPQPRKKKDYIHKFSEAEIESIQQYYQSDEVSFPLPDKKYYGKRFFRFNLNKCTKMYKDSILKNNARKVCHKLKHFLVKLWVTKTVRNKEGNMQSFYIGNMSNVIMSN